MDNHYDVIIIGSGAGGGTLAYHLAPSGKRILILERGDYVAREIQNWSTRAVNVEARYHAKEVWRDRKGKPLHPHTNYYVGGNTKFYGAALFRLRREDFGEIRHHGGLSPAWPITYDDLEPYYTASEQLYQVHGERGEDPTEPPASAPYPWPAVSHEPRLQELHDDLAALGHRPFHTPLGVMLNERNRRKSACIRCATCDGHPCLVNAKSDAQVCCVDPALAYPNVTLMTNALVRRLGTDASGRSVTSAHVTREGGADEVYTGDIVVASCGAINSAALLLRSANDRHPNGLGNSSGLVGRHYMGHTNSVLMAISRCANPTVFQKSLSLNDFYFGAADWPYPHGHISFVGKLDADTLSAGAPAIAPGWTLDLMAKHSLDFWLTSEDLPDPANRVTLDRDGNIVLSYTPNNLEAHKHLRGKLQKLLQRRTCSVHGHDCHVGLFARNLFIGQLIPLAGVAHQNGTLRFGTNPATSVLDVNCKAHDLDNLYVVDASFFPSSGAVNPALTVMANALRVGDHLLERLHATRGTSAAAPTGVPSVLSPTGAVPAVPA
jgi:choline dehydrogenase-like flavoprotein